MKHASLAQSVEHRTFNPRVAGSSPAGGFSGTYTAITNSIFNSKIGTEKNNVSMAEWSNAIDLRSISFGSAGSNPARDNLIHIFFTLAVAQLVERSTVVVISDRMVPGSNPGGEKKS
jgi:hypothetical protein